MTFDPDKIKHYRYGYYAAKYGSIIGFIVIIILAAGKEMLDLCGFGTPEWADFKVSVKGACDGLLMRKRKK